MSHDYKTSPTPKYRFFLFDPEPEWVGLMFFRSEAERDAAAKEAIDAYKDVDNGWSAEVERLLMGEATHVCTQTNVVKRPPAVARKAKVLENILWFDDDSDSRRWTEFTDLDVTIDRLIAGGNNHD